MNWAEFVWNLDHLVGHVEIELRDVLAKTVNCTQWQGSSTRSSRSLRQTEKTLS